MKDNILILNFEAHKPPTFKEARGKDYILYGAEKDWKNCYGDFLIDLYNESSIHNAIINGKVRYIVGQGWVCDDKRMTLQDKVKVSSFINNVGQESLKSLTEKVAKDKKLFGGFALQPIWSADRSEIVELHHIPFQNIRISVEGDSYFYTEDWKGRKPEDNEDFETFEPFTGEYGTNQLIYYREYRPGLTDYPLPDYQASVNYISSDISISTFVASNTSNGFTGGYLINFFNGEPTDEVKRDIERRFKKKFTSPENAGKFIMAFNDPDTQGVELLPLGDNGQDDRYTNLRGDVKEEIFTGHQYPIALLTKTEAGLANNADEIRTAATQFQNVYIAPEQDILEELFNSILAINGLPKCLKIVELEPIKEQISIEKAWEVMTMDEKREAVGLEPLKTTLRAEDAQTCCFNEENEDEMFFKSIEGLGYSDEELEIIEIHDTRYNPFTFAVTEVDKQILSLVGQGQSPAEIAKATNLTLEEVNIRLTELRLEGLLNIRDGELEVTEEGKDEQPEEELITVYKYVERPNVPNARSGSRDFCRRLMAVNRNFTRQEINRLNNEFGSNVWRNRGGWYHNPNTDVTTPYCRHIWQARTVKVNR